MPSTLRESGSAAALYLRSQIPFLLALAVVALAFLTSAQAMAADPFAEAVAKACAAQEGFIRLAGAVGVLGMMACLLLGFFNKLNWRWLSTGLAVSFFVNIIPEMVMKLAGGGCG